MGYTLSKSAKIALCVVTALIILFLAVDGGQRIADRRADNRIKKAEAEAEQHLKMAGESRQREVQLQQQLETQQQKLAEAEARANAAEQALAQVRSIRLKIEGDYQRVRDAKPDLSQPLDSKGLCERLKSLGKLPGDFKCE